MGSAAVGSVVVPSLRPKVPQPQAGVRGLENTTQGQRMYCTTHLRGVPETCVLRYRPPRWLPPPVAAVIWPCAAFCLVNRNTIIIAITYDTDVGAEEEEAARRRTYFWGCVLLVASGVFFVTSL